MSDWSTYENLTPEERRTLDGFVFLAPAGYFELLDEATHKAPPIIVPAATTLRSNLSSSVLVGSIPFTMASAWAHDRRFHSLHLAEQIRALKFVGPGESPSNEQLDQALQTAQQNFAAEMTTEDGVAYMKAAVLNRLLTSLRDQQFLDAACELLRQVLVMVWGAIEAFVGDTIQELLNHEPQLGTRLLTADVTKRYFPFRGVSAEALAEYGFNLERSMGNVLFAERRLDSLPMVRDVLSVLLPASSKLHERFADTGLWTLWQRRHLIVHRRSVVDKAYLSRTPDQQQLGSALRVTREDVESSLLLARDACIEMLLALEQTFFASKEL